jgi:hypothetical protein
MTLRLQKDLLRIPAGCLRKSQSIADYAPRRSAFLGAQREAEGQTRLIHNNILFYRVCPLCFIKNICAHHSRLWNRELSITPVNPVKEDLCWPTYLSKKQQHTRLSSVLAMLYHMMKVIHPKTTWGNQLFVLFDDFKEIPVKDMELPLNWRNDEFWDESLSTK